MVSIVCFVAQSCGEPVSTSPDCALARDERSHWHRVDAAEAWHFYAGAALRLKIAPEQSAPPQTAIFGPDFAAGERPQCVVPAHAWQIEESS